VIIISPSATVVCAEGVRRTRNEEHRTPRTDAQHLTATMPSLPQLVLGFWAALWTFLMPQHVLTPVELLKGVS
jgi:hypothetical protein